MSAANAKVQEPSMEEILASIRRIISDDQTAKAAEAPQPEPELVAPAPANSDSDAFLTDPEPASDLADMGDVLDLAEIRSEPAPQSFGPADDDLAFADTRTPEPAPEMVEALVHRSIAPPPSPPEDGRLLSQMTDAAVSGAFGSLARTVLTHNSRTLEDLVSDMLRPMLKVWLDDNLPSMVEKMVRTEIERVTRGGR